ncbi:hypothetical protein AN191_00165 [Loktanella sp. 5RATIMAR09]|uniref:hypothetical protein n=1 Tax=Loktanella sp. 5RATIMAR09 TaxID=1225655 RepID=UPI000707FE85|nr:hypothetical protein [Loktanella sp. 5RATIMAR09]KQI73362.1 hypothetical protein AN191_00165 [Loktanella sp. 5RATIMAR09]
MSMRGLLACLFADWSPTIGDPTLTGWITVAAYLGTSCLSVMVLYRHSGKLRLFWLGLAILLVMLAVNKQLDLQSALTAAGRCLAKAQGWYEDRRTVQIAFILTIVGFCCVVGALLLWVMRREVSLIWPALIGIVGLLAFIAIRAAGFHHFDQFIGVKFGGFRMNVILELGGALFIAINAIVLLWVKEKPRP